MITASSRSIADANLGKEPLLTTLKTNLASQYDALKKLYDSYQTNQAKIGKYHLAYALCFKSCAWVGRTCPNSN